MVKGKKGYFDHPIEHRLNAKGIKRKSPSWIEISTKADKYSNLVDKMMLENKIAGYRVWSHEQIMENRAKSNNLYDLAEKLMRGKI
jgi:hypothetical protein